MIRKTTYEIKFHKLVLIVIRIKYMFTDIDVINK